MSALLAQLRERGFQLEADDNRVVVTPGSKLTDELRTAILAHKPVLLEELAQEAVRRQQRVAQATRMLAEAPTRRAAYVAGDETGGVLPVTMVIGTADGLVTVELSIPKERWDPWLFLQFLRDQEGISGRIH